MILEDRPYEILSKWKIEQKMFRIQKQVMTIANNSTSATGKIVLRPKSNRLFGQNVAVIIGAEKVLTSHAPN